MKTVEAIQEGSFSEEVLSEFETWDLGGDEGFSLGFLFMSAFLPMASARRFLVVVGFVGSFVLCVYIV